MKALSIRQPWAWLILHAGKDIENRNWATNFRGRILVHAAKGMTFAEYDDAIGYAITACGKKADHLPTERELQRGGIIGSVEIVDCVDDNDSPWFMGKYGFVLRDPQPIEFTEWKGQLGFFNVPDSALPYNAVLSGSGTLSD